MCTIVDRKTRRRNAYAAVVAVPPDVPVARLTEMKLWLAGFDNGTAGFCSIQHGVSRYHIEPDAKGARAFDLLSAYWFSDPATAFAFKMRWA